MMARMPSSAQMPLESPSTNQAISATGPHATSPRLSSLHRRFRSTSSSTNSSVTTHPPSDLPPDPVAVKAENVRAAKSLLATVRDDWFYPTEGGAFAEMAEAREAIEYRSREEGSSDGSHADAACSRGDNAFIAAQDGHPYRFENPDAIATSIQNHKRKRRKLLEEEMKWNVGLRTWSERRDAWTGAVSEEPVRGKASTKDAVIEYDDDDKTNLNDNNNVGTDSDNGRDSSGKTSTSAALPYTPHSMVSNSYTPSEVSPSNPGNSPTLSEDVLLPIFPSLVPLSNPVRASIKPSMYPSIYSKVVIQGLKPTIPIPLPDMVGALVQGWKGEGNWPARSTVPGAPAVNESAGGLKLALGNFRNRRVEGDKGRVRRSVGVVKKVLGLKSSGESASLYREEKPELHGLGIDFEDQKSTDIEGVSGNKELMPDEEEQKLSLSKIVQ